MIFPFLTPQLFDALVIGVVLIGGAFAALALYRDLARPAPPFGAAPSDDVSRPPASNVPPPNQKDTP
ncbi:MAG: hypothetical protein SGI73_19610 [Chloroflexota bacterium]|nr:hypothetical protein [Chloroflexota bacterium]